FFFFSSRRRHTRSKRDWSSDVCSSDLGPRFVHVPLSQRKASGSWSSSYVSPTICPTLLMAFASLVTLLGSGAPSCVKVPFSHRRSEERRVGKECRSRRGRAQ